MLDYQQSSLYKKNLEVSSMTKEFQAQPKTVMTIKELAAYLRLHQSTIYRLVKCGQLPAFKIGSDWRFTLEEIEAWVKRQPRAAEGK